MEKQTTSGYRINADQVGIMSLYSAQTKELVEIMKGNDRVKVGTVDSFQENEKQVVILGTTTTGVTSHLECDQRTLVALSRGRECTIVVGNILTLKQCNKWRAVVKLAEQMGN